MSLDTHKYGYALKGTSVVLYRTKELRHSQYFCYADWTGGMYTTPTVAGSRSGGLIAQCWASLMLNGEDGYLQATAGIIGVVKEISVGIKDIEGVSVVGGEPQAMIVCFRADKGLNVYSIGDKMSARGWHINPLQNPACVHICVTVHHIGKAAGFLKDLRESVAEVTNSKGDLHGVAAIYGSTVGLPPGPVNELLKVYNDVVLKV
jgi:sphinganine-1-phosphate aldolase